jgi:predicted molibdopterin-dependent oxidoreductase YjgC
VNSVLTTCPYCSCGCALYLQGEGGRTLGVAASRNHPISKSRLCARGWCAHEAPAWGERLTQPLVRRAGELRPVEWGEALDTAAAQLDAVRASGKAVGVLGSARATNEENYLAVKVARGGLGTGAVDSCLRATYLPLFYGLARGSGGRAPHGTLADVEDSEVVILLDGDVAGSHPRAASAVLRAVAKGARLVTVSCRRTQLTRLSTLHLPVTPTGYYRMVAGLIGAACNGGTLESIPSALAVEGPPGLGQELKQAGQWYRQAGRASVVVGPEAAIGDSAEDLGAALAFLASVAGHLGRTGSVLLPLPVRWNLRGACEMGVTPQSLPGNRMLDDDAACRRLTECWGRAPVTEAGLDVATMVGEVGGLVVLADDPPALLRNGTYASEALASLDCLVVLDAFITPTVRAAHVVLPIASFAENEGTATSAEGRVQRVVPCVPPVGSARLGWQVLADLSARFGLPCGYASAGDVLEEIRRAVPAYGTWDRQGPDVAYSAAATAVADRDWGEVPPVEIAERADGAASYLLTLDGVFDWGSDPLVAGTPTLSRDFVSRRKLFPQGLVEMSPADAEALGVRQGWPVRIRSDHGEATLPVVIRSDVGRGLLFVPFGFREHVSGVLAGSDTVAVQLARPEG